MPLLFLSSVAVSSRPARQVPKTPSRLVPLNNTVATAYHTATRIKRARPRVKAPTRTTRLELATTDNLLALDLPVIPLNSVSIGNLHSPVPPPHVCRHRVSGLRKYIKRVVQDDTDTIADDAIGTGLDRRRKPHGFWNRLSNLETELRLANAQLGHSGRQAIPRLEDLKQIGRGDLVAALAKHGGVKRVSEALRWPRVRPSGQRAQSTIRSIRAKVPRRPADYWASVSRVHAEMGAFIAEFGSRGVMPTRKQLYAFGRSDLANAAERHGGLGVIARQMGVHGRKDSRPRGYWRDFSRVRDILVDFSKSHCGGIMPTADELSSKGLGCIVNAIASHGGFPTVAQKCGLKPRNARKQGAPTVWDEARVQKEYLSFLMTYYPQLARERTMVGERQLRLHGRNDLSYAISKFGGFAKLGRDLDLNKRSFRS